VLFGAFKFTAVEAAGIEPLVRHNPTSLLALCADPPRRRALERGRSAARNSPAEGHSDSSVVGRILPTDEEMMALHTVVQQFERRSEPWSQRREKKSRMFSSMEDLQ